MEYRCRQIQTFPDKFTQALIHRHCRGFYTTTGIRNVQCVQYALNSTIFTHPSVQCQEYVIRTNILQLFNQVMACINQHRIDHMVLQGIEHHLTRFQRYLTLWRGATTKHGHLAKVTNLFCFIDIFHARIQLTHRLNPVPFRPTQ